MGKFQKFLLAFAFVFVLSLLTIIYIVGVNDFFYAIKDYIVLIIIYNLLSVLLINVVDSLMFYFCGLASGLKTSFLNLYPLYLKNNKIIISNNIINAFKLKNSYNIGELEINDFSLLNHKARKNQLIVIIIFCITTIIIGVYFKLLFICTLFYVFVLRMIYTQYIMSNDYIAFEKMENVYYDELVFSANISYKVIKHHINALQKNRELLLSNAEYMYSANKLIFSIYNNGFLDEYNLLSSLDELIYQILVDYNNELSIESRAVIFDYIDNRICTNKSSKGDLKVILDTYISIDWGIDIPDIYIRRYNILKKAIYAYNGTMVKKDYQFFLINTP